MGMHHYPTGGYVFPLDDYVKKLELSTPDLSYLAEWDDPYDEDEVIDFLNSRAGVKGLPMIYDVFLLGDEDEPGHLERHVWYVVFDATELYDMTPTPDHDALGAKLDMAFWAPFG
jgi:hypothetical protein